MIYIIEKEISLSEIQKNFEHCPEGFHTHFAKFKVRLESNLEDFELHLKIKDVLTENTLFMETKWSLHALADILKNELISSGFGVIQVNFSIADMSIEAQI